MTVDYKKLSRLFSSDSEGHYGAELQEELNNIDKSMLNMIEYKPKEELYDENQKLYSRE